MQMLELLAAIESVSQVLQPLLEYEGLQLRVAFSLSAYIWKKNLFTIVILDTIFLDKIML